MVMRFIYSCLVEILRPFAFAGVLWRGFGDRAYWQGLGERFGFGPASATAATATAAMAGINIWVHAVSMGEVTAAAPLIRALIDGGAPIARGKRVSITLTTATPTGRARARGLLGHAVDVRFVPYDTPGAMRRLMERLQPRLVIIMETELWPNLFSQCHRRRIPVVLANARLSPKSVRRYRRFGGLFRRLFEGDTWVAAQSAADAARFIEIGANRDRTQVVGNIKFDVPESETTVDRGRALRAANWVNRPVWVAGSTHAGEEEIVLSAHLTLRQNAIPGGDALLLLVPRHPQRFASVAELLRRRGVSFERRSDGAVPRPDTQVLLVDTVGELPMLYAAADVAFVGGSLVPIGGHNLLEPAALNVPVLTGPFYANGREVAELLLAEGGALQVTDAAELAAALQQLFADPERRQRMGARARRVIDSNRGSLARVLTLLETVTSAGY
jgi:3-deoxy-D-manno-octulosonic-acid transferase